MDAQVCQSCSAIRRTENDFCAECGARFEQQDPIDQRSATPTQSMTLTQALVAAGIVGYLISMLLVASSGYLSFSEAFRWYSGQDSLRADIEWQYKIADLMIRPGGLLMLVLIGLATTRSQARDGAVMKRMCQQCSTISETAKRFCPACGSSYFQAPAGSLVGVERNVNATVSMTLGLVGIVVLGFILGPVAIVLALRAKAEMRREPGLFANHGSATAGIALVVVDVVIGAFFLSIFF